MLKASQEVLREANALLLECLNDVDRAFNNVQRCRRLVDIWVREVERDKVDQVSGG